MKTQEISCSRVTIGEGFWKDRQELNRTATAKAVYDRFYDTGRIPAYNCSWSEPDGFGRCPHVFWDSDVAKWIEGASYILMHNNDTELEEKIDWIVDRIAENRGDDGYFNLHYLVTEQDRRFTDRRQHETYCMGHYMEAAVAYYEATGKDKFLHICEDFAELLYDRFVVKQDTGYVTPGHPEVELALMRLYRATGNEHALAVCRFFIDHRAVNHRELLMFHDKKYAFDEVPLREGQYADGHCVRLNYLMTGACDLAQTIRDDELLEATRRVFRNETEKRMYITGSQGSTYLGERFTTDYDLPNKTAYTETCASISLGNFAKRLSYAELDSVYADTVERTLYNGSLSGVSLDGKAFFYENPLEIRDEDYAVNYYDFRQHQHFIPRKRPAMFGCACCPPNILRTIASVGGYIYAKTEDGSLYVVHQFISSSYADDNLSVTMETAFPKDGKIRIHAEGKAKTLAVRIPYYCKNFEANAPYTAEKGYAFFAVNGSLSLEIDLHLAPRFVFTKTVVKENSGRAALMYGPLVYCAENADNEEIENFFANLPLEVEPSGEFAALPTFRVSGVTRVGSDALYSDEQPTTKPASVNLIPYFAFANRGECGMLTFLHTRI